MMFSDLSPAGGNRFCESVFFSVRPSDAFRRNNFRHSEVIIIVFRAIGCREHVTEPTAFAVALCDEIRKLPTNPHFAKSFLFDAKSRMSERKNRFRRSGESARTVCMYTDRRRVAIIERSL